MSPLPIEVDDAVTDGVGETLQQIPIDPGPEFDGLAGFNAALARHIRSHPSLELAPAGHATRGGTHSGDLLAGPKGPMTAFEGTATR